jgi:hypothetical protein
MAPVPIEVQYSCSSIDFVNIDVAMTVFLANGLLPAKGDQL